MTLERPWVEWKNTTPRQALIKTINCHNMHVCLATQYNNYSLLKTVDWGYLNITVVPNTVPRECERLVKGLCVSSGQCISGTEQLLQTFHADNVEQRQKQKQKQNPRR